MISSDVLGKFVVICPRFEGGCGRVARSGDWLLSGNSISVRKCPACSFEGTRHVNDANVGLWTDEENRSQAFSLLDEWRGALHGRDLLALTFLGVINFGKLSDDQKEELADLENRKK